MSTKIKQNDSLEDDKFYRDSDQERSRQGCCTCQTLFLFLISILIIAMVGIFYLYTQFKNDKFFHPNVDITASIKNLTDRFNNFSIGDINNGKIILTENELNTIIASDISFRNFVIQNTQTMINPQEIIIDGSLVKPVNSKIVIGLVPVVSAGKINFTVESVTIFNTKMPQFVAEKIGNSFNDCLNSKLNLIYSKIEVQSVDLQNRQMTISGKTK